MSDLQTALDRPYGQTPEALAAATRRVQREPDPDLLMQALGLVDDPVIVARDRAKALTATLCPICQNRMPAHGVCRRSERCRGAARERGESA